MFPEHPYYNNDFHIHEQELTLKTQNKGSCSLLCIIGSAKNPILIHHFSLYREYYVGNTVLRNLKSS